MVGLLSENRRSLVYGLTDGMQLIADCFASLERIENFLLIEELNGKELNQQEESTGNENGDEKDKDQNETSEKPFLKVQGYVIFFIKIVFVFGRFFFSRGNPLSEVCEASARAKSAPARLGQAAATEIKTSLSQNSP